MRERIKELPEALQKQIFLRIAVGALSLILFVIVLILYHNLYLCLSFVFFTIVFFGSGVFLLRRLAAGKYVVLEGNCSRIERACCASVQE